MPYHHMWEDRAPHLDYPGIQCRLISLDAVHDVIQEDVVSDGPVLSPRRMRWQRRRQHLHTSRVIG